MDQSQDFLGTDGQSPRKGLLGPRPTPLKVNKDSHKIRKPPVAPQGKQQFNHQQPLQQLPQQKPMIIYDVSPKVIHADASEFRTLVQRLTGPDNFTSASSSNAATGALSPAARLATIEKAITSPEAKKRVVLPSSEVVEADEIGIGGDGDGGGVENLEKAVSFPGILSPGPGSLPPISPSFFSPLFRDSSIYNFSSHDSSVVHFGNRSCIDQGSGIPSPFQSNLFSFSPGTMFSPSSLEFLHQILEN